MSVNSSTQPEQGLAVAAAAPGLLSPWRGRYGSRSCCRAVVAACVSLSALSCSGSEQEGTEAAGGTGPMQALPGAAGNAPSASPQGPDLSAPVPQGAGATPEQGPAAAATPAPAQETPAVAPAEPESTPVATPNATPLAPVENPSEALPGAAPPAPIMDPSAPAVTPPVVTPPAVTPPAVPPGMSTAMSPPDSMAPEAPAALEPTASSFALIGYGAGTTGGAGGETVMVGNASEFGDAVKGSEARIVVLTSKIQWGGQIDANKTVVGLEDQGEITGGTVRLSDNVILRNLKIHDGKKGADLIGIYGAHDVWIDHCEIWNHYGDVNGDGKIDTEGDIAGGDVDMYDGIIDITGASGDITISWSIIHEGFKAMLKSASGNLTFHHNEFYNSWERVPSFNGGEGHLFNNYFHDIAQSCINVRKGAVARIEGNVFERVGNGSLDAATGFERGPIGTYYSQDGCWDVADNLYIESLGNQPEASTCQVTPPYEYGEQLQAAAGVKDTVTEWAGVGKLDPLSP